MELPGGDGVWLAPSPSPPGPAVPDRHDEHKVGTFIWPPVGTSTWPPVGTFSWPRTHVVAPLAIADLLPTRSIDTPCLGVDWALVSNLAAGAGNPHRLLARPAALPRFGRGTRRAHLRKHVRPAGCGAIDPTRRRSPHDGAVRELF